MEEVIKTSEVKNSKTARMSNFELLRIICMLFIIMHHFSVHSTLTGNVPTFNLYIYKFFSVGGKIAVNIYVLISGYFMINSQFKIKKLLKLVFETLFYSVIIYLFFCIFNINRFDLNVFINQVFSIFTKQYWFMSFFIFLYILSPFLNKLLKQCSKKEFIILIILLLVVQIDFFGIKSGFNLSQLAWFILLYISAAFIRLYFDKGIKKIYIWIPFFVSLTIILVASIFFNLTFWNLTSILTYIFSISTFLIFKDIKIKNSKFINFISSTTLGIYLIHDNNFIRPLLWNKWLNVPFHALNNNFWLFSIISILLVFLICCFVDLLRILIEKFFVKILKRK